MSENTEIYGGPYADEQDKIDAAFRDNNLDSINTEDGTWSEGAKAVYAKYMELTLTFLEPEEVVKTPVVDLDEL